VSFIVQGRPATEVASALARQGVFASHGNFYAQTVAERLGHDHDGLVRLGCACYTTTDEVARALDGLAAIGRGDV
jgi:selenocysteine lyase/cysteine desulfurase